MSWSDAVPNLLIGLREGLEAGLVVSILLAAVHRSMSPTGDDSDRPSTAPVWLGVLGAVMVAGSFAAVLTYSTTVLSSAGQQAVGGFLSVAAVVLVTAMVFWMRRTAAGMSSQLHGDVQRAVVVGAGALALTAFLAVAREGLETTLFLWTAARATGQTLAPLIGAGLGLAAAVVLCALLYRRAVRLNLGVFFTWTAVALLVIAAGVLAYGLGDLQDAGILPGQHWVAFDLTAHIDPSSWWATIVTGVTQLSPKMTVLQVVAWVGYLAIVVPLFVRAGRTDRPGARASGTDEPATAGDPSTDWWARLAGRRLWATVGVLVLAPVTLAGLAVALLPASEAGATIPVTVTASTCAGDWTGAGSGDRTFAVVNRSGKAGEVRLVNSAGAIVAEVETLGPATTADLSATLGPGSYSFTCRLSGVPPMNSAAAAVVGSSSPVAGPSAVLPVTLEALSPPNRAYQAYVSDRLTEMSDDVATLRADLVAGDLAKARSDWLTAQLAWERVGASYDSFGDLGVAIDGLPDGLPGGVSDPDFTGLHRVEYGLWHGQDAAQLTPVADQLAADVTHLQGDVRSDDIAGDPTNLPIRAHEILEDALRDHLSGVDDKGAGAAYPMTAADVEVTAVVLHELSPLIAVRAPRLLPQAEAQMTALSAAITAAGPGGQWQPVTATPLAARQRVNAAIGQLLQTLSAVPDLLEVPPTH